MNTPLAERLERLSLFEHFNFSEIEQLSAYMRLSSVAKGRIIYFEGDPANDMMVLITGRIQVSKSGDSGPLLLSYEGPGRVIGEMSLLDREKRSATCTADSDCEMAVLSAAKLQQLVQEQPTLAYRLMFGLARLLSRRLRRTSGLLADFMAG